MKGCLFFSYGFLYFVILKYNMMSFNPADGKKSFTFSRIAIVFHMMFIANNLKAKNINSFFLK